MATPVTGRKGLYELKVSVDRELEEAASVVLDRQFDQWPVSFSTPEGTGVDLSLFLCASTRPNRAELAELKAELVRLGHPHHPHVRIARLPDQNWKHSWKRHFKPVTIGRRLLLRPSWSRQRARPGQAVVVLDPGMSFGTGQHPTTRFCLEELVRARRTGLSQSALDIGTGSGILAISAAKLGLYPVRGFDNDPESLRVATKNAKRNRVFHRIRLQRADVASLRRRPRHRFDVVFANLLADLLIREATRIVGQVNPGGTLVVAGILEKEFDQVNQRFLAIGARLRRARIQDEWHSASYQILT